MSVKVRALRGVCIGPELHLAKDEEGSVDAGTAAFLVGINAVELVPEAPAPQASLLSDEPETKSAPAKSGRKEK